MNTLKILQIIHLVQLIKCAHTNYHNNRQPHANKWSNWIILPAKASATSVEKEFLPNSENTINIANEDGFETNEQNLEASVKYPDADKFQDNFTSLIKTYYDPVQATIAEANVSSKPYLITFSSDSGIDLSSDIINGKEQNFKQKQRTNSKMSKVISDEKEKSRNNENLIETKFSSKTRKTTALNKSRNSDNFPIEKISRSIETWFDGVSDMFDSVIDYVYEGGDTSKTASRLRLRPAFKKKKPFKKFKKKYKKFMFPLLLAYKLKFLTVIPIALTGLLLLLGSTGMAGFFFALFAALVTLRSNVVHIQRVH